MKILMLAPYVYRNEILTFSNNKSGFGMMVNDIATYINEAGCEVEMLTNSFTKEENVGYKIVKHSKLGFAFSLRFSGLFRYLKKLQVKKLFSATFARQVYYYLNTGFVRKYIKKSKPDIVHIHGIGILSDIYVDICKKLHVPCCVTAHGLLQNDAMVSHVGKQAEIDLFKKLEKEKVPVTVISTGIKRRLTEDYYGLTSSDNVVVVNNATNVKEVMVTENKTREELNIPDDAYVLLCVGSLLRQKGQIQVLRAYDTMPDEIKGKTYLVFAGSIHSGYPVEEEIEKLGIKKHVRLLGFVNHDELPRYYTSCDAVALASIDEGFGISLIEGMVYGVPFVTFADLDAVVDVYKPENGILCYDRNDKALGEAISQVLTSSWNKEKIKANSKAFSYEQMAENYVEFYKTRVLGQN